MTTGDDGLQAGGTRSSAASPFFAGIDRSPGETADTRWMQQALQLAEESVGMAAPNPVVGCVIVRDGVLVGRGAHHYDLRDHAEVVALREAGEQAHGATAYVTLEPCSHTGRTGPCAEALLRAGVRRVVAATADPNPVVSGRGVARLREAGVAVTVGVLSAPARVLNDGFARFIRRRLPLLTLKAGLSLDGRIAPGPAYGQEQNGQNGEGAGTIYLTGTHSLLAVQRMRHAADAVLTGVGTALKDNPLLTDRSGLPRRRRLLRVLLDSELRLPVNSRLVETAAGDLLVFTASGDSPRAEALRRAGVEVEQVRVLPREDPGAGAGRLDLRQVLAALAEREIVSLLVEGGSHLNRVLLGEELVDRLCLFYAPVFLGEAGVPLVAGRESLHPELQRSSVSVSGDDFRIEGYLRDPWR